MRIAFHAPFKPLDHPVPSGDRTIGRGLRDFLARRHDVVVASSLRTRWITARPWRWPTLLLEMLRAPRRARGCDVWLSYHSYYKAPDILGPWCSRRLGIPYALFQGIYATSRRRNPATWLGFQLNRRALLAADAVFTNKRGDHLNLARIIPAGRLHYVAPGLEPAAFPRDESRRDALRGDWKAPEHRPVLLAAAMFRDDVKTRSLTFLLEACGELAASRDFVLVLAGDGPTRPRLEAQARRLLGERAVFLGMVPRGELPAVYGAADIFAFPGVRESLGMVYLEAQCCGLPVVAFDGWGVPEVVDHGRTGLLSPPLDLPAYAANLAALLDDAPRRQAMGRAAMAHVRDHHDLDRNYAVVEQVLMSLTKARP